MNVIQNLLSAPLVDEPSAAVWLRAVDEVVTVLANQLAVTITYAEPPDIGRGFSAEVLVESGFPGLKFQGIVGCDLVDGQPPWVSATLFPFLLGRRVTAGTGKDFLYYRYAPGPSPRWLEEGWRCDEHDEYHYFHDWRGE